ncbi:MAG: GNAT family N-acetyltransferase [Chloroflexi bacterium]|nr:GNAT family N-acetyltransferase [Chloroflexota bacterium]
MKKEPLELNLSEFDEKRFGIRTAHAANITQENLGEVMDFCKANQVVFLVARCVTSEILAVHSMQRNGFLLMDTIMRFSVDVVNMYEAPGVDILPVRPVQPGEEDAVRALARETFRGYRGHYHEDVRLDPEKCDGIYASLAYEACVNNEETSIVHVCKIDGEIVGFNILSNPSPGVGKAILKCISPEAQKLGVGVSFVQPAITWYLSRGVSVLYGATQITNIASQKHMLFLKFQPSASIYTFHKWFD